MSEGPPAISVRTRFERFPATIKGAFVLQGADGDPHLVSVEGAVVARIPSGRTVEVPVEPAQIHVAPARDHDPHLFRRDGGIDKQGKVLPNGRIA